MTNKMVHSDRSLVSVSREGDLREDEERIGKTTRAVSTLSDGQRTGVGCCQLVRSACCHHERWACGGSLCFC